jgi:signal peptidase I
METEISPDSSESNQPKPYRRKIWVTVILSLIDPGLALIYGGNLKAGVYLVSGLLALDFLAISLRGISFTVMVAIVLLLVAIGIWLLIFNIRYTLQANRLKYPLIKHVWRWIIGVAIASFIISSASDMIEKSLLFQAYKTPSASMANTLIQGDYLMASKRIEVGKLQKSDLIIFKFPGDTHQNYVKRIAAVGGDRIKIVDKQLFVNDNLVPPPSEGVFNDSTDIYPHSDEKRWILSTNAWGGKGGYWEYLGNRDNMPEITVPEGSFFVLGDNRDNSADSRFWGPVDSRLVVGRPKFIHFSWDSSKFRIRWKRMGKRLK